MRIPNRVVALACALAAGLICALALVNLPPRYAYSQSGQAQRSAPFTVSKPGASSKAILFDSGPTGGEPLWSRLNFVLVTDVSDATLVVDWYAVGDPTAFTLPADWPGISANTPFQRDVPLFPGRVVVYIKTVTAPTTWKLAAELTRNRALSQ
jgi:hypothetical protein